MIFVYAFASVSWWWADSDSGSGYVIISKVMNELSGLLGYSFGTWEHLAPIVFSFSVSALSQRHLGKLQSTSGYTGVLSFSLQKSPRRRLLFMREESYTARD